MYLLCFPFFLFYFFLPDITKLRLQSVADVARQVEAELGEKTRLQTEQHQAQLAQLASDTERILSLEKELAELALQHGRELEKATERHAEELRELEGAVRERYQAVPVTRQLYKRINKAKSRFV